MNKTIDIWLLSQITSKVTKQIKLYHSMILNNHLLQNQCNQILTEMSIAILLFGCFIKSKLCNNDVLRVSIVTGCNLSVNKVNSFEQGFLTKTFFSFLKEKISINEKNVLVLLFI